MLTSSFLSGSESKEQAWQDAAQYAEILRNLGLAGPMMVSVRATPFRYFVVELWRPAPGD